MFKKINTSFLIPLIGIIGIFLLTGWDITHAAETTVNLATESAAGRTIADGLVQTINLLINLLTIIVTPAVIMAGWLLSPDWTSGDLFGLRPIMHQLWIMISNITYFIYAILLVFIALATIFNNEHYGYKALLPKLALGIILVPMTWWFVQFTISLATVITASVINVPQETMIRIDKEKCTKIECWQNTPLIPTNITFYNAGSGASQEQIKAAQDNTEKQITGDGKCSKDSCLTIEQFLAKWSGTYGSMLIYAYGVFHIGTIKDLPTGGLDMISTGIQILHQWLIGVILFVIFGILVLALVIMLLMRAIKLWFYAIFSPLFTLKYVLGDAFKWADKDDSLNITEFIGLAFVPAVVGLCLSFWLMIIGAIQSPSAGNSGPEKACKTSDLTWKDGCTILWLFGNDNNKVVRRITGDAPNQKTMNEIHIAGITINMEWNIVNPTDKNAIDKEATAASSTMSVFSTTGGIFGTIFIDIIALVFLWVSFMAAKGVSKAASAAMEPFEKMGKQIGSLGAGAYKYVPIPGTGGMSVNSAERLSQYPEKILSQMDAEKTARQEERFGKMLWMKPNSYNSSKEQQLKNATDNWKITQGYLDANRSIAQEIARAGIDPKDASGKKFIAELWGMIKASDPVMMKTNYNIKTDDSPEIMVAKYLKGESGWKFGSINEAEDYIKKYKDKPSSSGWNNSTPPPSSTQVKINLNGAPIDINITSEGKIDGESLNKFTKWQNIDLEKLKTELNTALSWVTLPSWQTLDSVRNNIIEAIKAQINNP